MLFIVTLTYRRPPEEIKAHLDAHRDWLIANTLAGRIAVAGPLQSQTGGLIVAHAPSRAELDHMMDQDPFVIRGLVGLEVLCVSPALRHEAFPARWAPDARSISEQ